LRPFPGLLAVLLASSLAGCFGSKKVDERCDDVAEYQASRDASSIQTPEGLVAPSQSSGYVVPPASGAELRGAACLARPPPYFRPDPAAAPPSPAASPSQAPPAAPPAN
jgi:uncharacterized lipoprotein